MTDFPPDSTVICRDLCKRFGEVRAVDAVTLALRRGECLALLGPSGCGKTTVLRLIAGLERPDGGSIAINGRTVSDAGIFVPPHRRRVGLVFQDYALFPHLTVEQNIAYGVGQRADRRERVTAMMALVGLDGLGGRYPHELSGGQQQRVALARALAPQPDILLLDEPFSNLDVALRRQVREDVLRILRQTGVSAILVTHDQEEAMSLGDRIALMFDGALYQVGTPRDLYERPSSRRAAQFMGDANFVGGQAQGQFALTALGAVPLAQPARGPVDVLIRPEALALDTAVKGARAVVTGRMYLGARQVVWVALAAGNDTLKVLCPPGVTWQTGQAVHVRVTGAGIAFPRL